MRPKLVLILRNITEIFLVLIAFSPSVGMSVRSLVAASEWRPNPNPEMEKAMREEIVWNEWRPRIVWTLVGLNVPLMVYAARRVYRA